MERINRSKESDIDQTLGCCQLSEIIRGFINDTTEAVNSVSLREEKAGGLLLLLRVITR